MLTVLRPHHGHAVSEAWQTGILIKGRRLPHPRPRVSGGRQPQGVQLNLGSFLRAFRPFAPVGQHEEVYVAYGSRMQSDPGVSGVMRTPGAFAGWPTLQLAERAYLVAS